MTEVAASAVIGGPQASSPRIRSDGTVGFVLTEGGSSALAVAVPGQVQPVIWGLSRAREDSGILFDWDASGMVWVDSAGRLMAADGPLRSSGVATRVLFESGYCTGPQLSPDGRRVAFVAETSTACEVLVLERSGESSPNRLSTAGFAWDPVWCGSASLAWQEFDEGVMPWEGARIVRRDCASDGSWAPARVLTPPGCWVAQPRSDRLGRLGWLSEHVAEGASGNEGQTGDGWHRVWLSQESVGRGGEGGGSLLRLPLADEEHGEPNWGPGQRSWVWGSDGDIFVNAHRDGWSSLKRISVGISDSLVKNEERVRFGWHWGLDHAAGVTVALRSGAVTPTELVRYGSSGAYETLWVAAERDPQDAEPELLNWEVPGGSRSALMWKSPSGTPIRGLMIHCHGGPTGASNVTYRTNPRFWTTRGWCVVMPNPAGSSGSGRHLRTALNGEWGARDVDEVAALVQVLRRRSELRSLPLVATGGSAGGMLALLLGERTELAFEAVMVRCPVSVPGSDEQVTSRLERGYAARMFGPRPGPSDVVRSDGPPIFIAHGTEDSVVPIEHSRRYAAIVRAQGRIVELLEFSGEGHSFGADESRIQELKAMHHFLSKHGMS